MNALIWTGVFAGIGTLLWLSVSHCNTRGCYAQRVRLHPSLRARIDGKNVVGFSAHKFAAAARRLKRSTSVFKQEIRS